MTMFKELAAELIGMFASEKRLTLAVLAIVAAVAGWSILSASIRLLLRPPLLAGLLMVALAPGAH